MSRPDLDVLVVGGGPVGLAVAIHARRLGLSATVVEPRPAPVDKACGEGLMPSALTELAALGVEVVGRPFRGIRYLRDGWQAEASFRAGPGLGVRRTELHSALVARAVAAGAELRDGTVSRVVQDADGVRADAVRARWLVAADGLHSHVRREAGLHQRAPGPARYGLRRHFRVRPWSDFVEVHWSPRVEAYVTPVSEDLVGVAVLGPRGVGYDEALRDLPALRARLRSAEPETPVRGAGPLRQRAAAVRSGRVLLAGDAAGYVDALTGEGLATGLASARLAVAAVAAGRPEDYPSAWARQTRRHRLLTCGLLAVSGRPGPRAWLVPAAARWPRGFARAVDLLA
jgi:flavin-dependent dehydrogenase